MFTKSQLVKLKSFYILMILGLSIAACNADSRDNNENKNFLMEAEIETKKIELYSQKGQCVIRFNNTESKHLSIPYPCGFVRTSSKKIAQTFYYKGIGHVLIVAGPIVDKSIYTKDDGVKPEHLCSNHGQAIIVNGDTLTLRKAETVKLGFCHQLGFDEKGFYGYAYPVQE